MQEDRRLGGPEGGYTDGEMRLIFERAGQLDVDAGAERRFSLDELREMGAQAGLNPADVTRAAADLRSQPARRGILGAPTRFTAVTFVERRLDDSVVSEVVLRVREATRLHGELRAVPGGMEWRARSALGIVIVDFSPKGEGTRLDVLIGREDEAALAALGAGFAGIAVGVAVGMVAGVGVALHGGPLIGLGVGAVAGIGSAWGGARFIWSRIARRIANDTSALMRAITETIDSVAVDPGSPGET
ncbi:MAG TPA: hypothetical protein VK636_06990 [Gemmatimonadaceae bacterium]|nr:hypothetical protein [Gemmatimonadaceae bacterium]